jgi:hypothetical protein
MSIASKFLRGVAVASANTIARPLLGKELVDYLNQGTREERAEEAEAKAAKLRAKADAGKRR